MVKKAYNKYFFLGTFLLLLVLSYFLVKPYVTAILTAGVLAYLFYPLNKVLAKYIKNSTIRALILLVTLFLVVLIPAGLVANVLVREIISAYQAFSISSVSNFLTETLNLSLNPVIKDYLLGGIQSGISALLDSTTEFLWSLPHKFVSMIIILFIFFFAVKDGSNMVKTISKKIPLDKNKKRQILRKTKETLDSLIHGVFAIAIIEGAIATVGFYIFGVELPLFWGAIVAIFALLPAIGPTLVYVPLAIYLLIQNQIWQGVGLLIYGGLLLSLLLDIIVKTKVLGLKGKIHPLMILLGVFGGLQLFGMTGILLGPVLLTILVLFFEYYVKETR